jgi:hypothetical protein
VRRPGEDSDYDTYVDRWFAERLAAALEVSKKMVENAGVDLSEALRDLQSAIAEAYPKIGCGEDLSARGGGSQGTYRRGVGGTAAAELSEGRLDALELGLVEDDLKEQAERGSSEQTADPLLRGWTVRRETAGKEPRAFSNSPELPASWPKLCSGRRRSQAWRASQAGSRH